MENSGNLVPSHKVEKRLRRLLISRLRKKHKSFFLSGKGFCGLQCEIRVVWGLTLISLAGFYRFPFLPCRLTFLGLNICVFHSLRI